MLEQQKMTAAELLRSYGDGRREFCRIDLNGADLSGVKLTGADLSDADLSGADLSDAELRDVDLGGANLIGTNLIGAKLTSANLIGAKLISARLNDGDLNAARLTDADLSGARLSGANLNGANLSDVNLSRADLTGARLSGVDLRGAKLQGVGLNQADLRGALLHGACVSRADLRGAVFSAAVCFRTLWADVALQEAKDLESVKHLGPSTVGIDTVLRSGGRIPDVFLRGCGVSEHVIELQKSLVAGVAPIQFYSCFISYSGADEEFAKRLHGRLQQEHLRVWFAPEDMKAGRKLHEQIDDAIRVHDKLLLVLSDASMKSEWVATEISKARKRERKEARQVLFPVRLVDFPRIEEWECFDADAGKDSAREIREYFIPDFSNWKDHDAFEREFAKLLRALRASAE
jgi:uncharacterized protein YjbI with pentapeptide repeats